MINNIHNNIYLQRHTHGFIRLLKNLTICLCVSKEKKTFEKDKNIFLTNTFKT